MYQQLTTIIIAGLAWAFCSDWLISHCDGYIRASRLEYIRSVNNLLLFGITVLLLYHRIKKQQTELLSSEKQYRALFESNPNPMWIYQKETLAFIAVNDAALVKYGYSRQEFLHMTIKDIRSSEDHAALDLAIGNNPGGLNEAGIWKHIRKSGEIFPVSIVSNDVFFNRNNCRMVMATDITRIIDNEQKLRDAYQKEKKLHDELAVQYEAVRRSEKENRIMGHVMNNINNLVIIIQEDHTISWVNRAFSDFTGYLSEEVIGKNPGDILCGSQTDTEMIELLVASIKQKQFFGGELVNYKKSGEPYWTQLSISPIYDDDGEFQFYISVETVITEKKEKEQKILAQHQALQRVAWSNSHELRKPVCSIIGLISVLKDLDNEKDRDECLAALEVCTRELDRLVKDINRKVEYMEV